MKQYFKDWYDLLFNPKDAFDRSLSNCAWYFLALGLVAFIALILEVKLYFHL